MATRLLDIGCHFRYSSTLPTAAVFMVEPRPSEAVDVLEESWVETPEPQSTPYVDSHGNHCRRLIIPQGVSTYTYSALVEVPDAEDAYDPEVPEVLPVDLPSEVLHYTLPSRFVLPDVIGNNAWKKFGSMTPGYGRVEAIMDWTWNHLTYVTGSSTPTTTAADAFAAGRGVCRDFTHLMITMCRALNIPARYAYGYLPDMDVTPNPVPMDFHAWVEVYLGDSWWVFDPRHNRRRKGRVRVAVGRDAADVAMVTTWGAPWMQLMTVTAQEHLATPA